MKFIHFKAHHNLKAAEQIVPVIMKWFNPLSVIDVGCGIGTWLKVFKDNGVEDILGIDGDHLNLDMLVINRENIILADLENEIPHYKKYDLALSLEVAEHLHPENGEQHIKFLTQLSEIVLFSAAVPGQGGQNHVNEQWIEYWQSIFEKYDYELYDELRPIFWNNENVDWWYRQNILLAIKKGTKHPFKKVKPILNIIHPIHFEIKMKSFHDALNKYEWGKTKIIKLQKEVNLLKHDMIIKSQKINKLNTKIHELERSYSYRIGFALTRIPAKMISILFKNRF